MPLTFQELYTLRYALDSDGDLLRRRVTVAVAGAAIAVIKEADTVANHAERLAWAQRVIRDGGATQQAADRMYWAVLGQEPITTDGNTATDGEIYTVVSGLVTAFALAEVTT